MKIPYIAFYLSPTKKSDDDYQIQTAQVEQTEPDELLAYNGRETRETRSIEHIEPDDYILREKEDTDHTFTVEISEPDEMLGLLVDNEGPIPFTETIEHTEPDEVDFSGGELVPTSENLENTEPDEYLYQ